MSSTRRNPAPRKRPASVPQAALLTGGGDTSSDNSSITASASAGTQFDFDDAKRDLLSGFDAALRENASGDNSESNAEIAAHFEAALLALTEEDALKPVSASEIKATLQETFRLSSVGIDTMDAAQQERQLDDALRSLERRETKIALEFNERIQVDGKDSALQWLQEQLSATPSADAEDQPILESRTGALSSSDTVKSRSRRLRGPPQKR